MKNTQAQLIETMERLAHAADKLGEAISKAPWPKKEIWQSKVKFPKPIIKKAL